MRCLTKSSFFWQFAAGFALGAVALVSLHPATASQSSDGPVARSVR